MLTEILHSPTIAMEFTELNQRGSPRATTDEVMLIQETMQIKGLYDGAIDGMPGKETLRAVRAYKGLQKMPVNNSLSREFIDHIRDEA